MKCVKTLSRRPEKSVAFSGFAERGVSASKGKGFLATRRMGDRWFGDQQGNALPRGRRDSSRLSGATR